MHLHIKLQIRFQYLKKDDFLKRFFVTAPQTNLLFIYKKLYQECRQKEAVVLRSHEIDMKETVMDEITFFFLLKYINITMKNI